MHDLLAVAAIAILALSPDAAPMRVDDVPVYGRVQDVGIADVHDAIASLQSGKPASMEVIDHDHFRAHLALKDLGWVPLDRCAINEPDGSQKHTWCGESRGIFDPAVLQVIRKPDQVFIFAVADGHRPRRDELNMRLIDARASTGIRALLSNKKSWFDGFDDTIDPHPERNRQDIGLVFHKGASEVVLFFNYQRVVGTFNGEYIFGGSLEDDAVQAMKAWEQQFAVPEMPPK